MNKLAAKLHHDCPLVVNESGLGLVFTARLTARELKIAFYQWHLVAFIETPAGYHRRPDASHLDPDCPARAIYDAIARAAALTAAPPVDKPPA